MKVSFRFRDSSMVEHSAVNRRVVGSNPTRGATREYSAVIPTCRDVGSNPTRGAKKGST